MDKETYCRMTNRIIQKWHQGLILGCMEMGHWNTGPSVLPAREAAHKCLSISYLLSEPSLTLSLLCVVSQSTTSFHCPYPLDFRLFQIVFMFCLILVFIHFYCCKILHCMHLPNICVYSTVNGHLSF